MSYSWLRHSLENNDGVLGTLRRALITAVDDSGDQQLVNLQALAKDFPQKIVRILPHGFSSNPPQNSEGVLKSLGGRSDRGMFIGGEHKQYRQKNLKPGNAVLYDDQGNIVFMQSGNGITVSAKKGQVVVQTQGQQIVVNPNGANVYLGGDPSKDGFSKVLTVAGPSFNVYAKI